MGGEGDVVMVVVGYCGGGVDGGSGGLVVRVSGWGWCGGGVVVVVG